MSISILQEHPFSVQSFFLLIQLSARCHQEMWSQTLGCEHGISALRTGWNAEQFCLSWTHFGFPVNTTSGFMPDWSYNTCRHYSQEARPMLENNLKVTGRTKPIFSNKNDFAKHICVTWIWRPCMKVTEASLKFWLHDESRSSSSSSFGFSTWFPLWPGWKMCGCWRCCWISWQRPVVSSSSSMAGTGWWAWRGRSGGSLPTPGCRGWGWLLSWRRRGHWSACRSSGRSCKGNWKNKWKHKSLSVKNSKFHSKGEKNISS